MSDQETADKYPQVVAVLDWDGGLSDAELASSGFCSAVARQKPRGQTIGGRNYYCWTKEARIRCAREYAGEIDPRARTTFADLPEPIAAEKLQQEEKVA